MNGWTESERNRTLQDWLLQERIIAQQLREKCKDQEFMIRDLYLDVTKLQISLKSCNTRLQNVRKELLEDFLDVLDHEDPELASIFRRERRRRRRTFSKK